MVQEKTILYNLIKKYYFDYKEKNSKEVKHSIARQQYYAIEKYNSLEGKRNITPYVICEV